MMSTYSEQAFKEKIFRLSLSQESIETLSLWVLQHKAHARDSVQTWLGEVKKASADKRLVLFYLANDILQNGRRRGADDFLELFQDPLRQAVTMIGGQKIQTSIERMFRIWKERRVYSNAFLKELELLIEPAKRTQVNEPVPDFKLPLLQDALSEFAKFQAELKVKSSHLSNLRVDVSNPTTSLSMLKDKSAGGRVSQHFEEASQKLQDYCECLGIEVNERINILDMLKECKIFTTYRLTELERTAVDYKKLDESVKEVKEKIEQRVKDLERAHSTATSDPSAKEDITDVGDMEIESDGESQPDSQSDTTKSIMPTAPGMISSPPVSAYPDPRRRQQQLLPNMAPRGGAYAQLAPPPNSTYETQQATHPGLPPSAPQFQPRPGLHRPPPNRNQGPLPPRNPPPQRLRGRNPQLVPVHRVPPGMRPPYRGPPPRQPPSAQAVPRPPPRRVPPPSGPHTISSSPVLYNRPKQDQLSSDGEDHDADHATDTKKSLDERLKDMMMNNKFGNRMLKKPVVDSQQDKPYSPSADDPVGNDVDSMDEGALPTPSDDSPVEESSPTPNMNNPILKALYKSQTSPDKQPGSLVPDYDQDDDELSTNDLKNILIQVKSSEPAENDAIKSAPPPAGGHLRAPPPAVTGGQGAGVKVKPPPPSDIKITPTLTSLLDEIFPKISKSLINRKRKQDDVPNDTSTKMPCPANTAPSPHLPQPHLAARLPSSPQPRPRPPFASRPPVFEGPRFSPTRAPFPQPAKLQGEEFPRPFSSYEVARPLMPGPKHRMEGRFVRPAPLVAGVGMQPRMMRTYQDPRLYRPPPPGYRPVHPRYHV